MKTAEDFLEKEHSVLLESIADGEQSYSFAKNFIAEWMKEYAKQLLEEYTNRIVENVELIENMRTEGTKCNKPFDKDCDFYINKDSITNQLSLMLKELGI